MAGGENWNEPKLTREQELHSQLAYRDDLSEAIGVIVSPPTHHTNQDGELIWGNRPLGSVQVVESVFRDLETVLQEAVEQEFSHATNLPPLERTLPTHSYDHPPAAQSIPEIAAMVWEHGQPILQNGVLLYEAGKLIRAVNARIREWFDEKNREISELNEPYYEARQTPPHNLIQPSVTLTQGALIALIVSDIVQRVGYQSDLEVDAHARGFQGYNSAGHPNPRLTYLIRVSYSGSQFGYVLESTGKVIEYFRIGKSELMSLPIPNILTGEIEVYQSRPSDEKLRLRMNEAPQ